MEHLIWRIGQGETDNIQYGAITQSIFTQILTKDTP